MLLHEVPLLRPRRALSAVFAVALAVAVQLAALGLVSSEAYATRMGGPPAGFGSHGHPLGQGFVDHGLPGLTLADLAAGESFESANGTLSFSDFTIVTDGTAPSDLDKYRIIPVADGFKLFSPLFGYFGHDASLSLEYTVMAADGLKIDSADFSVLGVAFKANTQLEAGFFDMGGASVGDLATGQHHFGFGKSSDSALFDPGFVKLVVDELISIDTGWFGALKHVDHRFHLSDRGEVVPEPGTALLLGLGIGGLTLRRRFVRAQAA